MNCMFIGIDYDEGDQSSYRATVLTVPDGTETGVRHRFETGNPSEDNRAAMRLARDVLAAQAVPFMNLSSWDHFVMDGTRWEYQPDPILADEDIFIETLAIVELTQGDPPDRWSKEGA